LTSARYARTDRIVRRLAEIGLPVEMERVRELAGPGTIGRPHVARAMIERGYVSSVSEAFDRFLGSGQPGFVPRAPNSPEDAVRLVRASGGVPVLAHPFTTGDIEHILRRLVPVGLAGMEVHYGEYDRDQRATLAAIAEHWSLIPTGGSDFHGPGFKSGRELGSVAVPLESVTRLRAAAETP
jgi:predicted metal-dependent phosphoesterase TrpH